MQRRVGIGCQHHNPTRRKGGGDPLDRVQAVLGRQVPVEDDQIRPKSIDCLIESHAVRQGTNDVVMAAQHDLEQLAHKAMILNQQDSSAHRTPTDDPPANLLDEP